MRQQSGRNRGVQNGGISRQRAPALGASAAGAKGLVAQPFMWSVGIESSTIPHLDVDQFEWTQHNAQWREDLRLVADELGLRHLRYSIPWNYLEPEPGHFTWDLADERLEACHDLGLEVMLDVMHFGTPRWLEQAAGDPEFPESLERLAGAMAERYRGIVSSWCPVNEPLVTSLFSGDFGFWPPHGRGWRGYVPVLTRVALGTLRGIRAIRRAAPEAPIIVCDAADTFQSRDETLAAEVAMRNARRFLLLDLIDGRVDHQHPLFSWLIASGMSELDLAWFKQNRQMPDAIGLDYYPHSDWTLDVGPSGRTRQRRADAPAGLASVAGDYFDRYGLPMIVTETSIEGKPINREVWLERIVEDARQLREEGVPLVGLTWWPLLDHLDWDGALTHRVGKTHRVGLYSLARSATGVMRRVRTPLADRFAELAAAGDGAVGEVENPALPLERLSMEIAPPIAAMPARESPPSRTRPAPTKHFGIVVFSHLRWGFVWQRPQQFLSRHARRHPILFIEEPMFDVPEGGEPRLELHQVMPNVTVACPHAPPSLAEAPDLPDRLRAWTIEAMERVNGNSAFDQPLLWYYSPMDASWSLGEIPARGVVYDCMDELSQFSGAPPELTENERRLMRHADIVFTGGRALWKKKGAEHTNVHFFGCGVEAGHFGRAMDDSTAIPPDIDFVERPIIGWFGVIDERVDYHLVSELARLRPHWSFAMVGPVVKVDPNLLPHAPNLYWLGGRDYDVLPNYCRAFDACMMCFAINESTEFINPTKALEYLATGRPVVSTPVRDVVEQWSDLIDIASTPAEMIAALERALAQPDEERLRRGLERARSCSWDETVDRMQALIREAIVRDDRPSLRPVEPIAAPVRYRSTPGS